jgi:uracil-DNA glycosylase
MMNSISTEGISFGINMKYNKRTGIVIFTALVILVLVNSLYVTPLTISDTDPSTYAIVPILMLPLFVIFTAKEEIIPEVRRQDIAIGAAFFVVYLFATIYINLATQYLFIDLRLGMLLLPLLLASLISFLFGAKNIAKFKAMLLYSIFASPAIFLFIYSLNLKFAIANTAAIYSILKAAAPSLIYKPPITLSLNGNYVGIGETCVGIGVLLAIIFFMLPLAYMYKGKVGRKMVWVAAGFAMLLLFNFLRMLLIALEWLFTGPSNALFTIHYFIGILLFYIVIIAMILLSGRFGLKMPLGPPGKKARKRASRSVFKYGIASAVIVAVASYLLTINYANATTASPAALAMHNTLSGNSSIIGPLINQITGTKGFISVVSRTINGSTTVIRMANRSLNSSEPTLIVLTSANSSLDNLLVKSNEIIGMLHYLDNSSNVESVYLVSSQGVEFYVYDKLIPYSLSNQSSIIVDEYVVMPTSSVRQGASCPAYYNSFYTSAFNLFEPALYNSSLSSGITSAYCAIQGLVGSMEFQYSAGAIIYCRENGKTRYLLLERTERPTAKGGSGDKVFLKLEKAKYDVAKGHIEKGESAEAAAAREVKEETGLSPYFIPFFSLTSKYFFFEKGKKIMKTVRFFIAESKSTHVRISHEHKGYLWAEPEEMVRLLGHKNMVQPLGQVFDYVRRWEEMKRLNGEYAMLPSKYGSEWTDLSKRHVPGEGRLDSKIMVVGQAPGANEDRLLRPFVGRSGELLNKILRRSGLRRERVYITSIVQFFPEKNRLPTQREIEICRPFLLRQIEIIKPRCIVLLGNVAASALLGFGSVEKNHGKIIEKDGMRYLITYHPAAALRFGKNIALMEKDLAQLKSIL